MVLVDGEAPLYATFEANFYTGWAHTKTNMYPALSSKVSRVIHHECWKARDNTELSEVKISVDDVYDRLEYMQLHKTIRLSELPLPGEIRRTV